MYQSARVPDVARIAVLRANGVGDFTFILPALDALRQTYPSAEIVLLGREWHAAFLRGRPGPIDRVVALPAIAGVTADSEDAAEAERCVEELKREEFDLALQMHGGGQFSNPFILRLGVRLTAGLQAGNAPPLDRTLPYVYFQPEVVRYLQVAGLVGAEGHSFQPRLAVTAEDLAESADLDGRIVVLHPGAGHPGRRWPASSFAQVGDRLAEAGARVVVTGTREEAPLVQAVCRAMRHESLPLDGRFSLGGLLGLFSRCDLVVANDSGALHLAAAAGARTAGIYWCFNMITAGLLDRTRHRPHVSWRLDCPVCGVDRSRGRCRHNDSFVSGVPPEGVAASTLELFEGAGPSAPISAPAATLREGGSPPGHSTTLPPLHAAAELVAERYGWSLGAVVTSSVLRGQGTSTSDLDLVVVGEGPDLPYRESLRYGGWPVEAFVHTPESIRSYFQADARRHYPSLPAMVAEGTILRDTDSLMAALQGEARVLLDAGPPPLTPDELDSWRYGLTDLVDDLIGCTDPAEGIVIAHAVAQEAANVVLLAAGQWRGTGKWLHRALARYDRALATQMSDALAAYARRGEKEPLHRFAALALDRLGGPLWEGFRQAGPSA